MMKMQKYTLLVALIFNISCSEGGFVPNKEQKKHTNNVSLTFCGTKEFALDSETSYLTPYIQLVDNKDTSYLTFYNQHNNSIYLYDYHSTRFLKKISYEKEGNNGVGDMQGYAYVNDDSVFVYSYWGQVLAHTRSDGAVLSRKKIEAVSSPEMIYPAPYIQTATPMKKTGNKIILCGFTSGETDFETTVNRRVCLLYDVEKQSYVYCINYPEQYARYNWAGGFTYRIPYFDTDGESVIVSFSADHYLTVYSLQTNEEKRYYAGSASIRGIRSYPQSKSLPIEEKRAKEWYMNNPSYQNVLYDKYRQRYYRLARLPVERYVQGESGNKKPTVVVVLDADFRYLGEVFLPQDVGFEVSNCFVSADGFNIQVLTDDEDSMTFYVYDFKLNEK
jgi:hypothetical protein